MQQVSALVCQSAQNEAAIRKDELQQQLDAGLVSQEEYDKELEKIDKERAQKEYKIKMWEWSANLASAVANAALGVVNSLKAGGILGMAMAALVGAAGAVQIATITANKPIPPSFATGGIVGGSSYSGDRVQANVNSGEMILNARQQRALWETANGGTGGMNVQINNSASNVVRAQPEMTKDGIKLMIRQIVSKDMSDGRYNAPMRSAPSNMYRYAFYQLTGEYMAVNWPVNVNTKAYGLDTGAAQKLDTVHGVQL